MAFEPGKAIAAPLMFPAGPIDRRLAGALVILSVAVLAVAAPFAKTPEPRIEAFIPCYESALVVSDLITATLLFGQFSISRSRPLLLLASGYLFTALMTAAHLLSFPGAFSATGLLGANPQIAPWLYLIWHAGLPVAVIAYARLGGTARAQMPAGISIGLYAGGVVALAAVSTSLTAVGEANLPQILRGNEYSSHTPYLIDLVLAVGMIALATLWARRQRSVLDVWLQAVLCAWLCDVALSGVLNSGRYDLGYYLGRAFGLLAANLVLIILSVQAIVSERKAMERREMIANEVRHRARNVLTIIQALARRTLPAGERAKFLGLLETISRTQDILDVQTAAPLRTLLKGELAAFADQVKIEGGDVRLSPGAAQNFALIIHELTTNAIKYGALSSTHGLVEITWREETEGRSLVFVWKEAGGPKVSPPEQQGFGSTILKTAAQGLDSTVETAFTPEGLRYELRAELAGIRDDRLPIYK